MTLAVLVLECLVEAGSFGSGPRALDLEPATYLSLMWAAGIFGLAGAWVRRDLGGWGMIAFGLIASAIADTYFQFYVDPVDGPYPSVADFLYFLSYALVIVGLRNLWRRTRSGRTQFYVLLTPLLGAATLWWWIALNPVTGTLEGTTAARLTTVAYPALDLLLICSVLVALATVGWRAGRSLALLAAGAAVYGIADSVYAAQVASRLRSRPDPDQRPVADRLAADGHGRVGPRPARQSRVNRARAGSSSSSPSPRSRSRWSVLVWDHYERFSGVTVVLALLTLTAAAIRLVMLYQEAVNARRAAVEAETERGRIETLHTASVAGALDGIVTADAEGRVLDWNRAAERIFGYTRNEAVGQRVADLIVPPAQREVHQSALSRVAHGGKPNLTDQRLEMVGIDADGREIPVELAITRSGTDPARFTAFLRDLTEAKRRDEERDRLADMVRSAQDAMISATLDGIVLSWNPAAERIYGYQPGEIVGTELRRLVPPDRIHELRNVSERVNSGKSTALETSGLRKDGEIIDVALQVFPVRDQTGRVIGASTVTRDITDRRRRERERRLDRERMAWHSQIEAALEHGGFEFFTQPILDLSTGEISHHELLLRMQMEGEAVVPGTFLPHAETSPLMRRIDNWAIRRGIELAAQHPVAINLSATSLGEPGTVAAVEKALSDFGADPQDVTFEITETAAVEDLEAAHSLVKALMALGCGVALDDFGTGYGSFTYLMRLHVSSLKIDMEFIRGLTQDPDDQRVVRAIVAVAQTFGLTTVAEGVETNATLELLHGLGVDQAQGYLIGRPSPVWTTDAEVLEHLAAPDGT